MKNKDHILYSIKALEYALEELLSMKDTFEYKCPLCNKTVERNMTYGQHLNEFILVECQECQDIELDALAQEEAENWDKEWDN